MTLTEHTDRAAGSPMLAVASRIVSIALAPLVVAAIIGGLQILREHDRAIIELQSATELEADRLQRQGELIRQLYSRQSATEAAAAGVSQRLDGQRDQLARIERLLERLMEDAAQ